MRKTITLIILLTGYLFFVNCSASGTLTPTKTNSTKILPADGIQVFINKDAIVGSDETTMALSLFELNLMNKLKNAGKSKFYSASEKCAPACKYKVDIVITKINEVTATKRALAGAFAGRAKIEANGKISDLKSTAFSEFTLEELSSGGTIMAGTTKDVAVAAAERIGAHLLNELGQ